MQGKPFGRPSPPPRGRTFDAPSLPPVPVTTVDVCGYRHYVSTVDDRCVPYPSVTTVLGASDRFDRSGLDAWRKAVGEEAALTAKRLGASRGRALHDVCEAYLRNDDDWSVGLMPSVLSNFKAIKPVLDTRVDGIAGIEHPFRCDRLRTGGRVDLAARFDGVESIIDFKGASSPKSRDDIHSYFVQTRAYAEGLREQHGWVARRLVVLLVVDGSPRPSVFVEDPDDWTELMELVFIHDRERERT